MANELRVRHVIDYEKTGHKQVHRTIDFYRSISGGQVHETEQDVGTVEEALLVGDFTITGGFVIIENQDATNFVSFRRATGEGNAVRIPPGCADVFFFGSTAPFVIADTAPCRIGITIIEA